MSDPSRNEHVFSGKTEQQVKEPGAKHGEQPAVPVLALKQPFEPDIKDGIFAIFVFILGFIFARWVLFYWQGWSVTVFTAGYLGATTMYFRKKGVLIPAEGWFWLVVTALTGASFSLWNNHGLEHHGVVYYYSPARYTG
ncbi:MAG: hypothetical protein KGZ79_09630 [Dethiobacter sp.]|jgi:hypothetical protein|nr:hypothetical protein [Dethiobacter sp.]MBS4022662.1 hypothetical protein [Dethiobacter sp.]